jgi:DNA-directed RNA polymerase specialized sigma24 family protein
MRKKRQAVQDAGDSRELLKSIIRFMKANQQLSMDELVSFYAEAASEDSVPLSVFAGGLTPSAALCSYLKRERCLSFHEIAVILNRDDRSVWTSCARAERRPVRRVDMKDDDILIPLAVFQDRSRSILEHVVSYLRETRGLSNSRIARLTNKNPSAIATVANRADEKSGVRRGR